MEEAKACLSSFARIVRAESGGGGGGCEMTLEQFAVGCAELGTPITTAKVRELFDTCDLDDSGRVDFREYLIFCAPRLRSALRDDRGSDDDSDFNECSNQ